MILGETALIAAVSGGYPATVEYLVTKGASIHEKNDRGKNLLVLRWLFPHSVINTSFRTRCKGW